MKSSSSVLNRFSFVLRNSVKERKRETILLLKMKQTNILRITYRLYNLYQQITLPVSSKPPACCLCYDISVCNYFYFYFTSLLTKSRAFSPQVLYTTLLFDKMFFSYLADFLSQCLELFRGRFPSFLPWMLRTCPCLTLFVCVKFSLKGDQREQEGCVIRE